MMPTCCRRRRSFAAPLALLSVLGCQTLPPPAGPASVDPIEQQLAAAAADVSASMAKLAIVEQSARRVSAQAITPEQLPEALKLAVDMDYQGDLRPVVYQLADVVGYRVQQYGRARASTPVVIHARSRPIGLILADVDYQSSWRVDVVVVPQRKLIELRYNRRR